MRSYRLLDLKKLPECQICSQDENDAFQNFHVDLVSIRQYQLSIQRPAYLQKSILYYHAVDIRIGAVRFLFFFG